MYCRSTLIAARLVTERWARECVLEVLFDEEFLFFALILVAIRFAPAARMKPRPFKTVAPAFVSELCRRIA